MSNTYRREIDGLRAVAVIPVVLYHVSNTLVPGGFVGVDVFFVISGYLITGLLSAELTKTGGISTSGFFERRVRRLAPALLVVISATLLLGFIFLSPIGGEQQGLARSALAALVLCANIYFFSFTGGYFDEPAEAQPLLHLWSLAVEEQFYLVWPWVLWALFALARRHSAVSDRAGLNQLLLYLAVLFVSITACVFLTPLGNGAAFYLSPMRAWEFAAGALAYWWLRYRPPLEPVMGRALSVLGIALMALAYFSLDRTMSFPGYWALLPVLGTALVIVGTMSDQAGPVASFLKWRLLVWIGLISYPLYLWHWPLLVMARMNSLEPLPMGQAVLVVTLALALSWGTLRYVETPIRARRAAWALSPRRLGFAAGQGVGVVVLLAAVMGVWSKWIWPSQGANASLAAAVNGLKKVRVPCGQPSPYVGTLAEIGNCVSSPPTRDNRGTIVVWGDSHAAHLVPGLKRLAHENSQALRVRYMPECPPLLGFSPSSVGITRPKGCEQFNADVLAEIQNLQLQGQVAGVYLNARWAGYTRFGSELQGASDGLKASLAALQQAGVKTTLVAPGPEFPAEVPRCLVRRPAESCDLPRVQAEAVRSATVAMMAARAAETGTRLVDPFDALCSGDSCPVLGEGEVLYSDAHHWTVPASVAVVSALSRERH